MRRGLGSARVSDFDDDVDGLEGFGELAFGFGDVSGVPVYFGALVGREGGVGGFGVVWVGGVNCGGGGCCFCLDVCEYWVKWN